MGPLNFLLDLLGLGFWLAWRGPAFSPVRSAGTLVGNLKLAQPGRRRSGWAGLGLLGVLVCRPVFLSMVGDAVNATPSWSPGPILLAFRVDSWARLFVHSGLSLFWTILVFQSLALFVARLVRTETETQGLAELTRMIAGAPARWPGWVGALAPVLVAGGLWAAGSGPLADLGVAPRPASHLALFSRSAAVGLSVWLPLRWLVVVALTLRLVQNYVFLGDSPFWDAVRAVGLRLEWPWNRLPLRIGRMDFTPAVAAGVAWAVGEAASRALVLWCNATWR